MIAIIYHDTFLSEINEDIFENKLSLEMRFTMTPKGIILNSNRNGDVMVKRYGKSFLNFFLGSSVNDAAEFLEKIVACSDVRTIVLRDRLDTSGAGMLFNGLYKKGKVHMVGYHPRFLSRITAEVVHELRNPLTVIKGFVQLSTLTQEFDKYHTAIVSEIDRMYAILENFLSYANEKAQMKSLLPDRLAHELIAYLSSECALNAIDFDYDIAYSAHTCRVDIDKMKQVIINLLRNALEALENQNGNKKKIFLRGTVEDGSYRFSLTDSGCGIDTEVLKHLGDLFYTTKAKGTGIGLSVCKKIISDHNGSFCLSSIPGQGTTVSFTLPFETKR
ncbi:ATP-binding protein [Sporolactobacillus spathodeae]|uniref:histidine kinase n=1 Tax=Sporolactobacillus spathodeae TaxID=1465502 RepID=A0ABS2Q6A2_9BACL|nr:signal transduction histidine kinase [Sporolactobacillus spathodeae]